MEEIGDQLQSCRCIICYYLHRTTMVSLCVCVCMGGGGCCTPQSGQSAKLFLQSSELGLPHPHIRRRVCPHFNSGGGGATLACGRGGRGVSILTRGQTLLYSVYIRTLCCTLLHLTHHVSELNTRHNPALTHLHWSPSCSLVLEDDIG
jgi:hypothetical protein